jgi:protein involved in polysaccharide export with SLBB domain
MLKSGDPLLMRHFLLAAFCATLISLPWAGEAADRTLLQVADLVFNREEVMQMLRDSGASERSAASMLESYPIDYDFTEDEVRGLLKSIPQEELIEEYRRRKRFMEDEMARGLPPEARRRIPATWEPEREPPEGEVRPFGYEIFAGSPLEYTPTEDIPVGPDYVLGPGDELYITLWGAVEKSYRAPVNRDGNIVLPELGVVHASGATLGEFDKTLGRRFSSVYSGFSMDVSLGKLRTIQVFVVGDVIRPGAYTISSVSTVFNALYYAGGPTERGSLRRVLLYRHGKLAGEVDLYDYLLKGDAGGDLRLRSGDTVFVTPIGRTAVIRGAVKRPAIYELKGGETVAALIDLAAGFTAESYTGRIDVTRIDRVTGLTSVVTTSSARASDDSLKSSLFDSSRHHDEDDSAAEETGLFPRTEEDSLGVGEDGEVSYSGAHSASGSTEARRVGVYGGPEGGDVMSSEETLIEDGDDVTVYTVWHVSPKHSAEVQGMVQFPGTYPLYPGMKVSDLIFKAGGLLDQTYLLRAEVSRIEDEPEASGLVSNIMFINLQDVVLDPDSEHNLLLERGDKVFVRKIPGWRAQHLVKVEGEVRFPGIYTLRKKEERITYIIERAGGLTPEAFPKAGSVYRENEGRVIVDFAKALENPGGKDDLLLVDGDSVHIPIYPNTIKVQGAVGRPGSIIFEPGKDADYYVERTGGFLEQADRGSVRIIRLDGSTETARKRFWFDPNVEPGNRITVDLKEKGPDTNWTATIRDATSIVASLATTIYIISRID